MTRQGSRTSPFAGHPDGATRGSGGMGIRVRTGGRRRLGVTRALHQFKLHRCQKESFTRDVGRGRQHGRARSAAGSLACAWRRRVDCTARRSAEIGCTQRSPASAGGVRAPGKAPPRRASATALRLAPTLRLTIARAPWTHAVGAPRPERPRRAARYREDHLRRVRRTPSRRISRTREAPPHRHLACAGARSGVDV